MKSQSLMEQHGISLKTKKQKMCDLFCKAMTHHSDVGAFKTKIKVKYWKSVAIFNKYY